MIGLLLAAALAAPSAPPDIPPLHPERAINATEILQHYTQALTAFRTPSILTFEYSVEQSGARDIQQTHRVFRSGNSQRDEILSVDGKKLEPPSVHIFLGRRNRYTLEALAPKPSSYAFRYIGPVRDGRHTDAVFATTALAPSASVVRQVQIDGVTFLPVTIRFATSAYKGAGSVTFARIQKSWLPTAATATAVYAKLAAEEKITFSRYRFPTALPDGTFEKPRPLATFRPTPL